MIVILLFQICLNMTFKCHYCEKEPFELKKFLNDHLAKKHNLEFPCYKCNEAFENQNYLAEHLSCHNGFQKVFPCGHCKEVFLDEFSFKIHVKERHIEEFRRFKCIYCVSKTKTFADKTNLKLHIKREHDLELLCMCHKCNQGFKDQEKLA